MLFPVSQLDLPWSHTQLAKARGARQPQQQPSSKLQHSGWQWTKVGFHEKDTTDVRPEPPAAPQSRYDGTTMVKMSIKSLEVHGLVGV